MELVPGSGVYVSESKIKNLHHTYSKSPRELVRQLMRLILGIDILRKSSATGKNGWTPIPTHIFEAVESKNFHLYMCYARARVCVCNETIM